jgi:hypothetical protein
MVHPSTSRETVDYLVLLTLNYYLKEEREKLD